MGCVYLVGSRQYGWYKIGCSKADTPKKRIKAISEGCPFPIQLVGFWKVFDHRLIENWLHKHFHAKHIRGEWFRLPEADLIECGRLVVHYDRIIRAQKPRGMNPKKARMLKRIQIAVRQKLGLAS
jgi:hypothetical protein